MNDQPQDPMLGRRSLLKSAGVAAAAMSLPASAHAMRRLAAAPTSAPASAPVGAAPHTLLYINLRGGADGLSFVAPGSDITNGPSGNRPTLKLTNPIAANGQVKGPGYWEVNRAFDKLMTGSASAWADKHLAFIPAAGLLERNRSHFVAMDWMEYGVPPGQTVQNSGYTDGFIARALNSSSIMPVPTLRGLVMQQLNTTSFREAPISLAIGNVQDFNFPGGTPMRDAVDDMHMATGITPLSNASAVAMSTIDYLAPGNGVDFSAPTGMYPANGFGVQVKRAAALLLGTNPAPEVIEVDLGGWDTHAAQGPNGGDMYDLMETLSMTLAAFYGDMKAANKLNDVSVIVVTEFGRRVAENSSAGTDHGWGSCMIAMGGNVNGGVVYDKDWESAGPGGTGGRLPDVTDDGDVAVLVDHRNVFVECFRKRMGLTPGGEQAIYGSSYGHVDRGIFS